ncbi:FAD:protein FMN transferase, partial [Staphylococcus epidermidis]|uniref:FAD:protein FMN transferase n=1 Tax=Staphylococcus epidermidis TaxID=1282 RepID=UPI0037DA525B
MVKHYFPHQLHQYFLSHPLSSPIIHLPPNLLTIRTQPQTLQKSHLPLPNPFHNHPLPLLTLNLPHQSVLTSPIYQPYFIHQNQLFHHIFHSTTPYPLDNHI